MITVSGLTLSFGQQKIFNKISLTINPDQRIGLVGPNGAGKSTLLKVISGMQQVDDGTVSINRHTKIAYLPQEVVLASPLSIEQETLSAFETLSSLQHEAEQLQKKADTHALTPEDIERMAQVYEELNHLNPDECKRQVHSMLIGLGFAPEQFGNPVAQLSVGWKMRIVLAKLLLKKADFYLFDEPTNHLDIVAKDWFVTFLKQAPFGFMMVCHERYMLDALCDYILELEQGNAHMYTGNYSSYEKQKEHNLTLLHSAYEQQQREIAKAQATIDRFRASASKARMAQSMIKALDKIERIEIPPSSKIMNFTFPACVQPGKVVLTLENVSHSFNAKKLFDHVACTITRGEKIALIAANGVGKTTLFNLIAHKLPLQHGTITFGHNVQWALFDQDQNAALNLHSTVFENIQDACPGITDQQIRSFLGAFLFSNDDIYKKVGVLSGGEKNRVGMVRTLLQKANLLLLDEPTNHLDIPSKAMLLRALQQFNGTIFFVSHDHDFISKLATHILELTPTGIRSYPGTYEAYKYHKAQELATQNNTQTAAVKTAQTTQSTQHDYHHQRELEKKSKNLEKKIDMAEREIKKLEESFANLEYGTPDYSRAENHLKNLRIQHKRLFDEWEKLLL